MKKTKFFINLPAKGVILVAIMLILALLVNSVLEIIQLKPFSIMTNMIYLFKEGEGIFPLLFEILVNYFFCFAIITLLTGIILRVLKAKAKDIFIFDVFIIIKIVVIFAVLALMSITMLLINYPPQKLIGFIEILVTWAFGFLTSIFLVVGIGGLIPYVFYQILLGRKILDENNNS